MEPISHHLSVEKTARYFTMGEGKANCQYLWIVLHGYGQLASSVIKRFKTLDPDKHFVLAPEGLSRFYWGEGFGGKAVASWMTSEDRS